MKLEELFDLATNIYSYGSDVYGVKKTKSSDKDYVVVLYDYIYNDNKHLFTEGEPMKFDKNIECHVLSMTRFFELLDECNIMVLECLYNPKPLKVSCVVNHKINLGKLRDSISKVASNSFVKTKKKLLVEGDYNPYIATKSMFHSLRIIMFGTQIAKYGKIVDYGCANFIWNDIVLGQIYDWDIIHNRYKPIYNSLLTEFRLYAKKGKK